MNIWRTDSELFLQDRSLVLLYLKDAGAAVRLFLVCLTLQFLIFEPFHLPFLLNVILTVFIVWLYTFRGGVKSLIWTDVSKNILPGSLGCTMHLLYSFQPASRLSAAWLLRYQIVTFPRHSFLTTSTTNAISSNSSWQVYSPLLP